jgi:hypothetical protein
MCPAGQPKRAPLRGGAGSVVVVALEIVFADHPGAPDAELHASAPRGWGSDRRLPMVIPRLDLLVRGLAEIDFEILEAGALRGWAPIRWDFRRRVPIVILVALPAMPLSMEMRFAQLKISGPVCGSW